MTTTYAGAGTSARRASLASVARESLLSAGAVLGVVCIVMTLLGFAFGVRPLVFRSGSMSPAIHTGDLAFARSVEAGDLRRGDIVSVINSAGSRITHRLVAVAGQGESRSLTLKGDANSVADPEVYEVTEADRVMFGVPRIGYLVGWMSGSWGIFLLGAYVMFLCSALVKGRPGQPAGAAAQAAGVGVAAFLAAGLAGGFAVARTSPTLAAWADPAAVSGTTLSATTISAPGALACTTGTRQVSFTWPAVAGATSYTFFYRYGGTTYQAARTSASVTISLQSGTVSGTSWVVANQAYPALSPATTWTSVPTVTRSWTLGATTTCT
jgi:signal peptidase I